MSARLTDLTSQLLEEIMITWQASFPLMLDDERTPEACLKPLAKEMNSHWYRLPDSGFFILRFTQPGRCATAQFITRNSELIVSPSATREVLQEAMREYSLKRLNAIIPSSLPWRDYKLLGFKHEGRVRQSVRFNGEWSDAEVMGALENEIGIPRRRRRKRRRKGSALPAPQTFTEAAASDTTGSNAR